MQKSVLTVLSVPGKWAEDSGEHPMTLTRFGKRIKARDGIQYEKTNVVWYIGIGLSES